MTQLRVFFDGACPMCRKEISIYQQADIHQAIDWFDVSQAQDIDRLPLPRETLLARFHVQTTDGELISGARAFIAVWQELPKWRWLGRAARVPGIPTMLELGYRGFLRIRPAIQRVFR